MTFGAEIWGPALISAAGSIGGGLLSGSGVPKETKMQRTQRKLIDKLISSLGGEGPFADLYNTDENAFNKAFVEPAQAMFRNKIAPQIQQQYIASGQQRGTGLDDTLTRAGVDLDALLNQHLLDFQQGAMNRQQNTIGQILGAGAGAPIQPSGGQNLMSSIGGYLNSQGFQDMASGLFKNTPSANSTAPSTAPNAIPSRKGYTPPDWMDYQLGDSRWGQS